MGMDILDERSLGAGEGSSAGIRTIAGGVGSLATAGAERADTGGHLPPLPPVVQLQPGGLVDFAGASEGPIG